MTDILNQSQLVQRLQDDLGLAVCTRTVHLLMTQGMPHDNRFGKRPRFHWQAVKAWIMASQDVDSVTLVARDKVFRRKMGLTG